MFENRRRFPRANYPCHVTMFEADHETILANTSNIGAGGLCVSLNEELSVGTKVDLRIYFPGVTTPFHCRGEIVRCRREDSKFFNIGIRFDALSELHLAFLEAKVAELVALEKGKS